MPESRATVFAAELAGTFGLMVAATGSIVFDGRMDYSLGLPFVAAMHFAGLFVLVVVFGRYSMAHFNPAVTLGFVISGHVKPGMVPLYVAAQAAGAVLGSLFVLYAVGDHAMLGLNSPGPGYSPLAVFGIESAATAFLMCGILLILLVRGVHAAAVGAVVGGIVALDVLFFGPVSGASMNPIRSLAPALVTGTFDDLWLYWTAPFLGTATAFAFRRRFMRRHAG